MRIFNSHNFGDALSKALDLNFLNQSDLAKRMGITRGQINNWVKNVSEPRKKNIRAIMDAMPNVNFYKEDDGSWTTVWRKEVRKNTNDHPVQISTNIDEDHIQTRLLTTYESIIYLMQEVYQMDEIPKKRRVLSYLKSSYALLGLCQDELTSNGMPIPPDEYQVKIPQNES